MIVLQPFFLFLFLVTVDKKLLVVILKFKIRKKRKILKFNIEVNMYICIWKLVNILEMVNDRAGRREIWDRITQLLVK